MSTRHKGEIRRWTIIWCVKQLTVKNFWHPPTAWPALNFATQKKGRYILRYIICKANKIAPDFSLKTQPDEFNFGSSCLSFPTNLTFHYSELLGFVASLFLTSSFWTFTSHRNVIPVIPYAHIRTSFSTALCSFQKCFNKIRLAPNVQNHMSKHTVQKWTCRQIRTKKTHTKA